MVNVVGLQRVEDFASPEGSPADPSVSWHFTVDGLTLNELHGDDNVGVLGGMDQDFANENLRRLLGEPVPAPTFEIRWAQKPRRILGIFSRPGIPFAWSESAFPDGRVGLTYCFCGDLDCGVLSANIEVSPDRVAWREVAFQTTFEPPQVAEAPTYFFDRAQYESVLCAALNATWIDGTPVL